ncbi:hypothetical protein [Catellatospora paridis]|uniref:hypothetical protein n=1 Tax=Catellatospora paridis TaxID=1617086 RepID=UPI0012D3A290|nr:hypothetical protein [Catellatospora paridis]
MVSTAPEQVATASDPDRPVTSYRTDLVTVLLGTWFTIGLMVDAWAHNNVPELETFFTPWHAVFYWGFIVTAGWILWTCRAAFRGGRLPDLRAMPAGYPAAVLAIGGFALAGLGDMLWHVVFGVEQTIDILFSPTHLGLVTAMMIIVTTPLRTAWARRTDPATGLLGLLPAVLSIALGATLVLLFLQYANALVYTPGRIMMALTNLDERLSSDMATSILVTNLVLILPILTLARRWALPPGSVTVVYAVIGALCAAITGFGNLELIGGLLVAGVLTDLAVLWLRPSPGSRGALWAVAALAGLFTWSVYLAIGFLFTPPLVDPSGSITAQALPELYTGIPVVQALAGLLVAVVLAASARPAAATERQ